MKSSIEERAKAQGWKINTQFVGWVIFMKGWNGIEWRECYWVKEEDVDSFLGADGIGDIF